MREEKKTPRLADYKLSLAPDSFRLSTPGIKEPRTIFPVPCSLHGPATVISCCSLGVSQYKIEGKTLIRYRYVVIASKSCFCACMAAHVHYSAWKYLYTKPRLPPGKS